ncbi:MAG: HAMP domain-containing histidine kinase [Alphaproteobacteria bacterium]|nr:HAMP domain-containing histidine kinase [Alphaproteobacteria bacterium]
MVEIRPQRQRQDLEIEGDREALEHIARALEGRVLLGSSQAIDKDSKNEAPGLDAACLKPLLEALPMAIGILAGRKLVHANSALANAFGYSAPSELLDAGGLDAVLPDGGLLFAHVEGLEITPLIDALTRSRRKVKVAFAVSLLDPASDIKLLRLIDQPDLDAEQPVDSPAQSSEIEAKTAARRIDFLAKVSHEVRTPLNSIIGFAELMLQERFGPIGSPRYKGYIEDIHQSGLYALSLLNDLLDISKIEAGKFELDFTAVDLSDLVENCVNSLQPLAKRARIVLRTSLSPDLPMVVADPRRLKQIVLNLLTNAIKFTKEGGQVIVSGTMLGGELRLRVHDNGIGMTADEIAYAMQPFHQLDTTPRRQAGTGLGLPVTKALADANRARLVLSSEPGVGTSADVIFPAERLFTT